MRNSLADIAREFVTKFPRHSQKVVASAMCREHPALFSFDSAYKAVQSVSSKWGAKRGVGQAKGHVAKKPHVPTPTPPAIPASKAKPWLPFRLDAKRVLVLSDVHVPYHDTPALGLAIKHGEKFKPDTILLNGDIADFYSISRFETDPKQRNFAGELDTVRQFLRYLRVRFPKAQIVYKLGNHEERWWHWIWKKAPELMGCDFMDFPALVEAKANRIEVVDDQRIVMLGKLPILHGHEWRSGISTPVNPARGAFLKAIECAMQGHLHRSSEHTETSLLGKTITCWSTGCLCDLHPEYARVNRWNHGFAEIEMHGPDFQVINRRVLRGKVF